MGFRLYFVLLMCLVSMFLLGFYYGKDGKKGKGLSF